MERYFWRWASVIVALFLAASIARDLRNKMWFDQLCTLFIARQANPVEIVKATLEGCDGAPPLYSTIVHSILPIVKSDELAVRLPSTLGFCAMILGLLAICRRRMSAVYSIATAMLASELCFYYSTEGRCYGAVLGCAAVALLCWQRAAEGRRRGVSITLLALCLALMVAFHTFAIFFLAPLFLGEMVRAWESGKLDIPILAAMTPALFVLGLHYPFIVAGRRFTAHYWSPASLSLIVKSHDVPFLYPLMCLLLLALVAVIVLTKPPAEVIDREKATPIYEWVVLVTLWLMRPAVIVISTYTTHVYVSRYTLWAMIGFAILAGKLLHIAARGQAAVGLALLAVLSVWIGWQEIGSLLQKPSLREGEAVLRELEKLPDGNERIVVPSHHVFVELSYYAEPRIRGRLVNPVSRELDLRYLGFDSEAMIMDALSHRTTLDFEKSEKFLAENPRFIVAIRSGDYLLNYLDAAGYRVVPIDPPAAPPLLYEAEARKEN
jgi:hypothetical protein